MSRRKGYSGMILSSIKQGRKGERGIMTIFSHNILVKQGPLPASKRRRKEYEEPMMIYMRNEDNVDMRNEDNVDMRNETMLI